MKLKAATTDEQQLIAGCKEGKPWAQKQVFELYASAMLSVCVRYVNERETARDLLQDGFIKVFTKIDSYSGNGAFAGWIRRIFVTTALEYDNYLENNDESILAKISADDLMSLISQLSDGYRTVFNLYAIEGYSHAEIAEMLNISEVTSRSQFMRARKILQQNIQSLNNSAYAKQYK